MANDQFEQLCEPVSRSGTVKIIRSNRVGPLRCRQRLPRYPRRCHSPIEICARSILPDYRSATKHSHRDGNSKLPYLEQLRYTYRNRILCRPDSYRYTECDSMDFIVRSHPSYHLLPHHVQQRYTLLRLENNRFSTGEISSQTTRRRKATAHRSHTGPLIDVLL